jgi:cell division protein FtsZ
VDQCRVSREQRVNLVGPPEIPRREQVTQAARSSSRVASRTSGEGEDRALEAARRAISSPLLEGASVNGARGVIINVTGGPDLSLIEVNDASTIVQEAAHEDANIIFGAVVDPGLKGKVKITVIATGFGGDASLRSPAATVGQTPVDMTPYADHSRARVSAAAPDPLVAPRLSITRRPLLDLPLSAAGLPVAPSASSGGLSDLSAAQPSDDFDLGPTFDVPAFLRRQEN